MLAHDPEPIRDHEGAGTVRSREGGADPVAESPPRRLHAVPASYDAEALARAYAFCADTMRRSASSFSAALWMMPRQKRQAVQAIYAFCRLADDIADDPSVAGDRTLLLARWRSELVAAYEARATHPVTVALSHTVRRFDLPSQEFEELLLGIESDLNGEPMRTFGELRRYCYRVASTVGLLVVRVLGYRNPRTLEFAEAMGIAVQLTNVLRDVGEDAAAGRVYLAREDLDRMHVAPATLARREMTEEVRLLLALYAERARIYYERADDLLPDEDWPSLRAAAAMGRIYRTMLEELQRRGFPCLRNSIRLSRSRRAAIAASVWFRRHPVA
jgi:phytoene synthase